MIILWFNKNNTKLKQYKKYPIVWTFQIYYS